MKASRHPSRRSFLVNAASGALGLTLAGGMEQKVFSGITGERQALRFPSEDMKKFVPVMLTPYNASLGVDFEGLSALIDFYIAAGAKGFFANCLSSEMYDLDDEERLAVARHVVRFVDGRFPVVATGSFGKTNEERADFVKKMYDTGVDAVILITSHFAEKGEGDDVLTGNLEKVLSRTGRIPLGTYECPSPYKRLLTPGVLRFLLSTNRLVYHKDTSLDPANIRIKLDVAKNSRLELYDAHSPNAMQSLRMGAKGMSCIAGNFYPEIFAWMCQHATDNARQEEVEWMQGEITRMDSVISQGYSLSAKYFLQKRGVPVAINSRKSKTSLTRKQQETLDGVYMTLLKWHERLGISAPR